MAVVGAGEGPIMAGKKLGGLILLALGILGVAFGFVGLARSVYTNVFGKGRELHFQADTPIQVQLAPGRSADQ